MQSTWLTALSIISLRLLAISAPLPMHGIYLHNSFPYSVHFPVSVLFHILVSMQLICLWFVFCYVPRAHVSTLIPVSVCATLLSPTWIYKPGMSCMSPQFVHQHQLDYYCHSPSPQFVHQHQLDYYCHSPSVCDLSLLPCSISSLQKLFDSHTSAIQLLTQPKTFPPHPPTLQLPCNPWDVHIPAYIQNTWTTTEGQCSAWAEAIVHTSHCIRKPTRPDLHIR